MVKSNSFNKTLSKCHTLSHLKQIQAKAITRGHSQNQIISFKLIRSAISLSHIAYAFSIFHHQTSPNSFLYTAMVSAYTFSGRHSAAVSLFRHMIRRRRPPPDLFLFPPTLRSCVAISSPPPSSLHAIAAKYSFNLHPVIQTALLDSYSRVHPSADAAQQVFDEMTDRSVVSWTAMVAAYARVGHAEDAVQLLERMPVRDTAAWNAAVSGCTQGGSYGLAMAVFRRMVWSGGEPNRVTFACALSASANGGALVYGRCVHSMIYRRRPPIDGFLSTALVDMYGKCGSLSVAVKVFYRAGDLSIACWNAMIGNLALHGCGREAVALFEKMVRSTSTEPDEVTFIGVLAACSHSGLLHQCQHYFNLMTQRYGIKPTVQHYGCVVDVLGRAGKVKEAMAVAKGMRGEADDVIWASLLSGCRIHGDGLGAELSQKKLTHVYGGCGTVLLANVYGEMGRWEEAGRVRRTLEDDQKDIDKKKIAGCSWIEINGRLHQFYSLDKRHPEIGYIYRVLKSLVCSSCL